MSAPIIDHVMTAEVFTGKAPAFTQVMIRTGATVLILLPVIVVTLLITRPTVRALIHVLAVVLALIIPTLMILGKG